MLLWTRDAQRLAWCALERDLALSATERTPLRLHGRRLWRRVDSALLRTLLGFVATSHSLRRRLWEALKNVSAAQLAQFAWLWCEWMAMLIVTDSVARWILLHIL